MARSSSKKAPGSLRVVNTCLKEVFLNIIEGVSDGFIMGFQNSLIPHHKGGKTHGFGGCKRERNWHYYTWRVTS